MKKIGIIDNSNFLGQRIVDFFNSKKIYKILKFNGETLSKKQVEKFVQKCDIIINISERNKLINQQTTLELNIQGAYNVIDACFSHKKGLLACVERKSTADAYSISQNVQKSIVSEFNKLGFQGFLMKLDSIINSPEFYELLKEDENKLLELLKIEDVCRWVYSFSDSYLVNGSFYVKEFEFWNPLRVTIKELKEIRNQTKELPSLNFTNKIYKFLNV